MNVLTNVLEEEIFKNRFICEQKVNIGFELDTRNQNGQLLYRKDKLQIIIDSIKNDNINLVLIT